MGRQQSHYLQGFLQELSEFYHANDAIGSGGIRLALECLEKFFLIYFLKTETKDTPALRLGRLLHTALLEPRLILRRVKVGPEGDRRTKAVKEAWEEFNAKIGPDDFVMTAKEADTALGMINRIVQDRWASGLVAGGIAERSGYVQDEETGLWLKFRPDYLIEREKVVDIVDYKTVTNASFEGFQRAMHKYGWDIQAAHYSACAELLLKKPVVFTWIAQEKEAPFTPGIYTATREVIEIGEALRRRGLRRIKDCMDNDRWPGYTEDGPQNMTPASWRAWQHMDEEEENFNG